MGTHPWREIRDKRRAIDPESVARVAALKAEMAVDPDTFTGCITLPAASWDQIEFWADETDLGRDGLIEVAVEHLICALRRDAEEDREWLREWRRERTETWRS